MTSPTAETGGHAQQARTERRALAAATSAHALHDGYTDVLYLLLPVWQAEFGLGFAEVGALRSSYTAVMAVLQVPASLLAERIGPVLVLVGGTMLAASCFLLAGASAGLFGTGCGTGHRRYRRQRAAPDRIQHRLQRLPWGALARGARRLQFHGRPRQGGDAGAGGRPARADGVAAGDVGAGGARIRRRHPGRDPGAEEESGRVRALRQQRHSPRLRCGPRAASSCCLAIGAIDNASRSAFLTFLPFLLQAKGASLATIGVALSLVLAGGAAGKLACGYIGARLGVLTTVLLTEGLTAAGIVALLPLRLGSRAGAAAADRHCAQRYILGAVRHGAGVGRAGGTRTRFRGLLHRHHRGLGGGAAADGPGRRRARHAAWP